MLRTALTLIASFIFVTALATTAWADDATEGSSDLVGTYRFVSGEKYGGKEPSESLKQSLVAISKDEIVATDANNKRTYVASYKLDKSKKPWQIEMQSIVPEAGAKAKGLVSLEGDELKLIYALPGGDMPTEFKTKEKQLMFVMKAETKAAKDDEEK